MTRARADIDVVILDRTTIPTIDSTGFNALLDLRDELAEHGVEIWVVNPSSARRQAIDNAAEVLGDALPQRFDTFDAAIAAFEQRSRSDADRPGEIPSS